MEGNYKIQVKLGNAEFSAEGPEATVKEAFEKFLQAIASRPPELLGRGTQSGQNAASRENEHPVQVDRTLLDRVFSQDGDGVSLRLLPPESPNRHGDAAILLLYGYRVLENVENVPVIKLNASLKKSGISIDRVDRVIGVHSQLFMKGGTRSGGRYTLNNQGVTQAENWLRTWFR